MFKACPFDLGAPKKNHTKADKARNSRGVVYKKSQCE